MADSDSDDPPLTPQLEILPDFACYDFVRPLSLSPFTQFDWEIRLRVVARMISSKNYSDQSSTGHSFSTTSFPNQLLKTKHIEKIRYYGQNNRPPVYFRGAWNFNRTKKFKANDKNIDSESDDSDGASADVADTDIEAFDSQHSGIMSQDTDGTWSRNEYDGTAEPGSKRGREPFID
ncbi:hypothetical protein DEU56DRAFT_756134 [Suillus clintonianus]|uniref:uncharacterized protein n=1 Tax=Suillus clintonianus TaxID=1904413 RepID=UPI001B864F2D|nr:uncharacterized protein DEU56DRAFT_756134 [Suillus clintonianus]KAG2136999.1 hypothetical protein DEU56DRAFT_756134 [Suillus clintonianus]